MKILFVCSARAWGGNEKWSSMAISELGKQGHSVSLLLRNPFLAKRFGKGLPWSCALFVTPFDPFSFLTAFFVLLFRRPDVVVSTKKAEYFVLGVLTRLFGIRHILRLGIVRDLDSSWRKFVYTRLNEGIIVNAQRTKDNFKKYDFVDQNKIRLIYNGIPEIHYDPPAPREDSRFHIVSVGVLKARKGFHLLMEAIAALPDEYKKKVKLTILGSGLMKTELQKLRKDLNLEDIVDMAGFQSNPVPYLQKADLFALLSENEGISNALLEAMILGLPAFTTVSGGTAEFMRDSENGFLVDRDVSSILSYLVKILDLDAEALKSIGQAGKGAVQEFFSLERMGKELERFLRGSDD